MCFKIRERNLNLIRKKNICGILLLDTLLKYLTALRLVL